MKPSYEELEEQLNRSRRLCDAALANERAWETAMMQACGEDGPKSVADKFAELEARCAALAEDQQKAIESIKQADSAVKLAHEKFSALAAENAALKAAHPQPFGPEMMKALDAYEKYQDEVPETGMLNAFFILRDSIRVDTPATDAFLAEVRAQGLNAFIQHRSAELDAHIKNGGEQFDEKSVRIRDIIVSARLFREQIRKEAAQ